MGASLYQVLAGHPPYRGSHEAIYGAVLAHDPPPLAFDGIAGEVAAVAGRAMAREPGDRFDHVRDVAEALLEILEGARAQDRARRLVQEAEALRPRPTPRGEGPGT